MGDLQPAEAVKHWKMYFTPIIPRRLLLGPATPIACMWFFLLKQVVQRPTVAALTVLRDLASSPKVLEGEDPESVTEGNMRMLLEKSQDFLPLTRDSKLETSLPLTEMAASVAVVALQ